MKFIKIFIFIPIIVLGQTTVNLPEKKIKLLFAGDLMNHGPQIKSAYVDSLQIYDYSENFVFLRTILSNSDLAFVNLETTLGIKPFTGYPNFSAPSEIAAEASKLGFNVFVTANNHSCDKNKTGIIKTLDILDKFNIIHSGTYRNKKERDSLTPLFIEKKGFKLALLNYSYGTNRIKIPYPTKVNLIDTIQIKKDLIKTKKLQPDEIIVFLHWGTQYQNKANIRQKKLAKWLHNNGVNLVIGSHPHVIQPIDIQRSTNNNLKAITIYSLGNFISNQRIFPRDGSMLVSLELSKIDEQTYISKIKVIPIWVYKYKQKNKFHYTVLPIEDFKFQPTFFQTNSDYQKMMKYYKHFLSFGFNKLLQKPLILEFSPIEYKKIMD